MSKKSTATPLIPWIGGKRRLAKHILPHFPEHQCYVEPFCGAAALFFLKAPSKVEVLNDINGELMNLYAVVQNHLEEFVRQFDNTLVSREMFMSLRATPPESLTCIQRAARFFYLQKICFGARVSKQSFGAKTVEPSPLNLHTIEEDLSAARRRLARATIESLAWVDCVTRYDRTHTLFYMDPPYFGLSSYGSEFGLDQYAEMARLMREIKGNAITSVNDIPEMRLAFDGFEIRQLETTYRCGTKNRSKPRKELLIFNFNP